MSYNPWYGWCIGFGFSAGPFHFGFAFGGYGGYWGPPIYRPPYRPPYPPGGWYGYNRPGYPGNRPYPPGRQARSAGDWCGHGEQALPVAFPKSSYQAIDPAGNGEWR